MYSSHSYIRRYVSDGHNTHTAYCACGDSITEKHTNTTDMDLGVSYCTKCNHRMELWDYEEEHKTE